MMSTPLSPTHDENIDRPTFIEVSRSALVHNVQTLKKHLGGTPKIMAVVKANGYGHDLVKVAQSFLSGGADYLGVALVEEAVSLRLAGIREPILVFGGVLGRQIETFIKHDIEIAASSVSKLQAIEAEAHRLKKRAKVHLKIDTGMGRIGVQPHSFHHLLNEAVRCTMTDTVGIFSHLATAEEVDDTFARLQIKRFIECKELAEKYSFPTKPLFHLLNSGGCLRFKEYAFDMVRAGVVLYGCPPHPLDQEFASLGFEPALTLKSKIVYFKVVPPEASVSYSRRWIANSQTRVVTIPIGYGDGYPRALSNKGHVLIRGKKYPIIGSICMDQLMVDIGLDEAFNDDEVVLIGEQGSHSITVGEVASLVNTVEHEILTSLNKRLPRVYID